MVLRKPHGLLRIYATEAASGKQSPNSAGREVIGASGHYYIILKLQEKHLESLVGEGTILLETKMCDQSSFRGFLCQD